LATRGNGSPSKDSNPGGSNPAFHEIRLPRARASLTVIGVMLSLALMSTYTLIDASTGVARKLCAPWASFEVRHTDAASGV
jgi:hypothetical protein